MELERFEYREENVELQTTVQYFDNKFKELCNPPKWLEEAESPFKWFGSLRLALNVRWPIPDKLTDYRNQGADYGFEKFTLLLALVAQGTINQIIFEDDSSEDEGESIKNDDDDEEGCKTDTDESETMDVETAYAKCNDALQEMVEHEGDIMYNRIGPAFHHILQATRAHMLLLLEGNVAESKEIAKNIKPVAEMSQESRAGIEGIKAKFILSVYKDLRVALQVSQKAMELDPYFGAWKYLTAKIIRRLRREYREDIPKEELEYFEKAVELERNPKYIVFLAQAYQETAQLLLKRRGEPNILITVDNMLSKAVDLFRECWSLKSDSAAIARRVGNGMMKMKPELIDLVLTKESLLKTIELSPNNVTYHMMGKFYYKYEKDDEKALECFKKTDSLYGVGEIIRLNIIKDPSYDPYDHIQRWEERTRAIPYVKEDLIYCDIGWYYLCFKKDLNTAVEYFWKILKKDFKSFRLMEFTSYEFCVRGPYNMIKILANEIMLLKEKNKILPPESKKDMEFLDKFLEKVLEKHPELVDMKLVPNQLERIQNHVQNSISTLRKRRYGHCFGNEKRENYIAGSWRTSEDRVEGNHESEATGIWSDAVQTVSNQASRSAESREKVEGEMREGMSSRGVMSDQYDMSRRDNMTSRDGVNQRYDMNRRGNMTSRDGMNQRYDMERRDNMTSRGGMNQRYDMNTRDNITSRGRMNQRYDFNSRQGLDTRDGARKQYNNYNQNRYDVTVTNWRSENRSQGGENH